MNRTKNWTITKKAAFIALACVVTACFTGAVFGDEPPVPANWVENPSIFITLPTAESERDDALTRFAAMGAFFDSYLYPDEGHPNYENGIPAILTRLADLRAEVNADPGLKNDPQLTGEQLGFLTLAELYRDFHWPAGTMDTNMDGVVNANDPEMFGLNHALVVYNEAIGAADANLDAMEEWWDEDEAQHPTKYTKVYNYAKRAILFIEQAKDHRFIITQRMGEVDEFTRGGRAYIDLEHNAPQYPQQ